LVQARPMGLNTHRTDRCEREVPASALSEHLRLIAAGHS